MILVALAAGACAQPGLAQPAPFSNEGETVEKDKIWNDRFEYRLDHGACSRLRDARTDSPADKAECERDFATPDKPLCLDYKGWAQGWFEMAEMMPSPSSWRSLPTDPPYYRSPQYRDMLGGLWIVASSWGRSKWSTSEQFADYAYKICLEGHPF